MKYLQKIVNLLLFIYNTIMKKTLLWIIIPLIAIQFIRMDVQQTLTSEPKYKIDAPKDVLNILKRSCFDCHSNHVNYPWYDTIVPASWYVKSHVKKGRKILNFDIWNSYNRERKSKILKKFSKAIVIRMPLPTYLWLHEDAKLSTNDKKILNKWVENLQHKLN
jgi:hypothetical protein